MPIATYADYKNQEQQNSTYEFFSGGIGLGLSLMSSAWTIAPFSGTAPSTAVAVNNTTQGAMFRDNLLSSYTAQRYLSKLEFNSNPAAPSSFMLIDRLSHQGGLSGIVTAAQTTNLPTAALPRYTDGVGVYAAIEIYTAIGSTATTATVSYTNQAGTPGRTSKTFVIGGAQAFTTRQVLIIPLQDGDTGVRSVESVTLAASTATAGNFGITLFKPLFILPVPTLSMDKSYTFDAVLGGGMIMPELQDGCCISIYARAPLSAANFTTGSATMIEG